MNRLKELRDERGLSMRGIESRTKIKFNTYSRYESSERDMSTEVLKQLATFFEVTIDYLLCYTGYCLYAKYKEGNFYFKIREDYYKELKEKKYIYFDNNDNRCINVNSLLGLSEGYNGMPLIQEMKRVDSFNALFEKKVIYDKDFKALEGDFEQIELTKSFIEMIKDAISEKK